MDLNSVVVVTLHTPREKIWGELLSLNTAGITVRGIDLNSYDDFVRQVLHPEQDRVGLPTLFFPMQRVERISLDADRVEAWNALQAHDVVRIDQRLLHENDERRAAAHGTGALAVPLQERERLIEGRRSMKLEIAHATRSPPPPWRSPRRSDSSRCSGRDYPSSKP